MEELQVIETTEGRQFKPWATKDDLQAAVQDPASVTAITSEIAGGKQAIAAALTQKGVPDVSPTDSFNKLAQDIQSIQIQEITIDGGDMYAKQLYGVANNGITPGYWNLYEVLADLLSDARLSNYGGILLAEYYRGYDSLALSGAGAGGAYVVSDMENGLFKMYTNDTTHTWATEFDGKGDRWVAYCFADEYHDFDITDTNTSPRSIFIGRKVGTITNVVNGRISKIVVPDGNELKCPEFRGFANAWDRNIVLRFCNEWTASTKYWMNNISANSLYLEIPSLYKSSYQQKALLDNCSIESVIIKANKISSYGQGNMITRNSTSPFICLRANEIDSSGSQSTTIIRGTVYELAIISEYVHGEETVRGDITGRLSLGYITNDKTKSVYINVAISGASASANDVCIQEGWCKPLSIAIFKNMTEANMYAHILQHLKQDEPYCGDGVTITLGATNLAKLTSAESVQLLDDLTNIYGYTFA